MSEGECCDSMALYHGFAENGNVTAAAVAGLVHLVRPKSVVMALAMKWQSSQEKGKVGRI